MCTHKLVEITGENGNLNLCKFPIFLNLYTFSMLCIFKFQETFALKFEVKVFLIVLLSGPKNVQIELKILAKSRRPFLACIA